MQCVARPKKPESEKRNHRLTHYMTDIEEKKLAYFSEHSGLEKTKIVQRALEQYFQTLENPPELMSQSKYDEVMKIEEDMLRGFICSNGHTFWLKWAWPSPPSSCPICGTTQIKRTWNGIVKRGF